MLKMPDRISLTEAARKAPRITARGDSRLLDDGAPPTLADLAGALQFALGDGRIWMNDERIVLLKTQMLGSLRRELIGSLGRDATRALFFRIGWQQGQLNADLLRKRFHQDDLTAALAAGPRLHTMEGFVKVSTKRFEFDIKRGHYHGEFHWHDSTEAIEHLAAFGLCDCPTCWLQIGVPSGFTTALLGHPVIFREVECMGQGAERCVVIGRNAAAWGDDLPELDMIARLPATRSRPRPKQPAAPDGAPGPAEQPHPVIGKSAPIERAKRLLDRVAGFAEPVLFLGEAGTGKAYFARHLHEIGRHPTGPFVVVNCDSDQLDSHLFGAGGALAQAQNGTLFLNDLFAMPRGVQARLAEVLADPAGRPVPLRVMSASGEAPQAKLHSGALRADLYFRLSLLPIMIPPLRDRRDDLPILIDHFLRRHARQHRKPLRQISAAARDLLLRYDFPGNLRELSNMIERGVICAEPGGDLEISHLFTGLEQMPAFVEGLHASGRIVRRSATPDSASAQRSLADIEHETYHAALAAAGGNISAAARRLGISRAKLDYRLAKLGLKR